MSGGFTLEKAIFGLNGEYLLNHVTLTLSYPVSSGLMWINRAILILILMFVLLASVPVRAQKVRAPSGKHAPTQRMSQRELQAPSCQSSQLVHVAGK
jgi:hypothetical protein